MDIQTISVVIAAVSVVIGVINSILSSRRAEKNDQLMLETRQAQLFTQIYDWWRSRDGAKAYGSYRYKYVEAVQKMGYQDFGKDLLDQVRTGDFEAYADQFSLMTFLEGIGVLVKKGLVDIELVEDLLSQRVIWIWEQGLGPNVEIIRKEANDPTQYDHIEYLYHELKHRQRLTARPEVK
jgi:hypothetical protein